MTSYDKFIKLVESKVLSRTRNGFIERNGAGGTTPDCVMFEAMSIPEDRIPADWAVAASDFIEFMLSPHWKKVPKPDWMP